MPRKANTSRYNTRSKNNLHYEVRENGEELADNDNYIANDNYEDDVEVESDEDEEDLAEESDEEFEEDPDFVEVSEEDDSDDEDFEICEESDERKFYDFIRNFDLEEQLEKTVNGQRVLHFYQKYGYIDTSTTTILMSVLRDLMFSCLSEQIADFYRLKPRHFDSVADKIMTVFPNESKDTYYAPKYHFGPWQTQTRGSVRNMYYKTAAEYKKLGMVPDTKRKSAPRDFHTVKRARLDVETIEDEANQSSQWLKESTGTWEEITYHWENSRPVRIQNFESCGGDLNDIFAMYPVLSMPQAFKLVVADYNAKYKNKNNLYELWPGYSIIFQEKMVQKLRKNPYAELLQYIDTPECNDNTRDIILFRLIPILWPYKSSLPAPHGDDDNDMELKTPWRPTKLESAQGFVFHVEAASQLDEKIQKYTEMLQEKGHSFQPTVVVVGPNLKSIDAIYVFIDNHKYLMKTMIEAMDTCYKMCFIFNAAYPAQCDQHWLILQRTIYKYNCMYDNVNQQVLRVVNSTRIV